MPGRDAPAGNASRTQVVNPRIMIVLGNAVRKDTNLSFRAQCQNHIVGAGITRPAVKASNSHRISANSFLPAARAENVRPYESY